MKIAALCTMYYPWSHADVIVTRWLDPHPHDAVMGFRPQSHITSLFVMQTPQGDPPPADWFRISPKDRSDKYDPSFDISQEVAAAYGVPMFGSIRDALTLGGDTLAVDAVLLIGEHGDFPENEYGQKLYPRKEMWDEVIAVFRESGRVVPVFVDKHLSWNMDWAREMVSTAQAMGVPLFAGSSIPITGPKHDLFLPATPDIAESLGLFYVGAETYGIHSMEFVQSLIEQRAGGEQGIVAMTAFEGEAVWEALANGAWSRALFEATLAACPHKQAGDYRENCAKSSTAPVAVVCEHAGGHRQTHVMLHGHLHAFAAGLKLRDDPRHFVTYCDTSAANVFVINFANLCREIERFFATGVSPAHIERLLLTTLEVATMMQALKDSPGRRIETPHLRIAYGNP
jgi:hypothetical protein